MPTVDTSDAAAFGEIAFLRSKTLPQLVQREMERLILSGELRAGERVNEAVIARRLGVSRGTVREALRTLEEAGLVRFEKNRGVAVREISREEAADIYEIRASLEELVCRRVALTITSEQVNELRILVERMDKAAKSTNVATYHPLNIQFHDRLVELARNRELATIYKRLVGQITLFRQHNLAFGGALPLSNADHRQIVEKLAAGNPAAAGKAMHNHIIASSQRLQQALTRYFEAANAQTDEDKKQNGPIAKASTKEKVRRKRNKRKKGG